MELYVTCYGQIQQTRANQVLARPLEALGFAGVKILAQSLISKIT